MSRMATLLNHPTLYAGFHSLVSGVKTVHLRQQLATLNNHAHIRVLDMGCGPGTNAALFLDRERYTYLGIDIDPACIQRASQKWPLTFQCSDIASWTDPHDRYDVILLNSVIHHLPPAAAAQVFERVYSLLATDGVCFVLDMVRPEKRDLRGLVQRGLIRLDRGSHCRSKETLRHELSAALSVRHSETFNVSCLGIVLWELVLFTCSRSPVAQGGACTTA